MTTTPKSAKEIIDRNRMYNERNYDRIPLNVHKGDRAKIQEFVKANHPKKSVNAYIKDKIREDIPDLK